MSPENQWLEDVFPTEIVPLFTGHVSFRGCRFMDHFCPKIPCKKKKDSKLDRIWPVEVFSISFQVCLEVILASKNSHLFVSEASFSGFHRGKTSALGPPTREAATVRFKALAAHTVHLRCGRSWGCCADIRWFFSNPNGEFSKHTKWWFQKLWIQI